MNSFSNISARLGQYIATLGDITALRSYQAEVQQGDSVLVAAKTTLGDTQGGIFVWDRKNTQEDDGDKIIQPLHQIGAGRWIKAMGATGPQGIAGPVGPTGSGPNAIAAYGPIATPTEAAATLSSALTAAGPGGVLYAPNAISVGTANPLNPGVEIIGKGIFKTDNRLSTMGVTVGQRPIQKIGRDHSQMAWGHEYLIPAFLHFFRVGHPVKIALIGDSNTEGYAGPYLAEMFASFPNTTVQNFGVSGSTFEHFRTNTGPVAGTGKDITAVLAFQPDLLIDLYGGTNDAYYDSGTPETFYASKRLGYQAIRAHANGGIGDMAIVMVTAGPMADGGSNRDERFNFEVRPRIIALAEEFECAFSDKNGRVPDAAVDVAGTFANIILDPPRVHTQEVLSKMLARWVFEDIVPSAYRPKGYTLLDGQVLAEGLSAAKYPQGVSMGRVTTADFPNNGFVMTVRPESTAGAFPIQINYGVVGPPTVHYRVGVVGGGWSDWREWGESSGGGGGGSTSPVITPVTPASGYTLPTVEQLSSVIAGSTIHMQGFVLVNAPAPTTVGQTIATLPVAAYPEYNQWFVDLVIWDGTNWEKVRGRIEPNGTITTQAISTISANRIYIYASWAKFI